LRSFSQATFWLCIFFWHKNFGAKDAIKMLMKLTPGIDAIKKFTPSLGIPSLVV
jgi:hypothetical protein